MVNKSIKAIAKIERDARNYFFVKMLYGFSDTKNELKTIYEINDEGLMDNLVALSYTALNTFTCGGRSDYGSEIVIYDVISKNRYYGYHIDYREPNHIIVGTMAMPNFSHINYLIRMISFTMEKENIGEFFIQYKEEVMNCEEFYNYQKRLFI